MKAKMRDRVKRKCAAVLTIVLVAAVIPSVSYAATTQEKINKAQEEKNNLEGKLNETHNELEELKGEHKNLKGELKNLNTKLTNVSERLADLEQHIEEKEQDIAETQAELEDAIALKEWQFESMKERIKQMYENNGSSNVEAYLNAGSIAEMLNIAEYFRKIAEYDQKKLEEFKENQKYIEEEEARLQAEKIELDSLKVEAEAEKNKVAGLISQTSNNISQYADQISEAEQQALDYEANIKEKEKDLDYLNKKLAEEIAMSQSAANSTWRNISEVSFAEGDRYLLANLIYCEAGGESYAGQLAVGAVVINRVLSSVYPDTVVGVIYQSGQFSPVASGRLDLALASNKATANCYKAADEAMSGITNVGNCVYFRTPVEGLTGISIGGHIFY